MQSTVLPALAGDALFALAGFLAALFNAAAGGGTLLSFPLLVANGLSPLAANATSTVGLLPGALASVLTYRSELSAARADVVRALAPAAVGGTAGALLLVAGGERVFAGVVPVLLAGAAVLLLLQSAVARWFAGEHRRRESGVLLVSALLLTSVYWGYFGAGGGILFLAAMGVLMRRPIGQVNALKVAVNVVSNAVAAATFVAVELGRHPGAIALRAAAPIAIGAIAGGWLGVRFARRLPSQGLRAFAAAVGLAMAVYLLVR